VETLAVFNTSARQLVNNLDRTPAGLHREISFRYFRKNYVMLERLNVVFHMTVCRHLNAWTQYRTQTFYYLVVFVVLSYATCNLAIGGVSVCPSHAGNASKLITIGSCSFQCRKPRDSSFLIPTFTPEVPGEPSFRVLQTGPGWIKRRKPVDFRPMIEDRHTVTMEEQ